MRRILKNIKKIPSSEQDGVFSKLTTILGFQPTTLRYYEKLLLIDLLTN